MLSMIQPWAVRLGETEKSVNKISKFILEGAENKGICLGKRGNFALVVSLSSARLSGRQAVCKLPTDEIDG